MRAVVSSQIQPPESQQSANINFNSPVSSPVNSPVISATTLNRRGSTDLEDVETNNGIMILDDRPQRRRNSPTGRFFQYSKLTSSRKFTHSGRHCEPRECIYSRRFVSPNENQSDQHNGTDKNTFQTRISILLTKSNTVEKHAEGDIKIEKCL